MTLSITVKNDTQHQHDNQHNNKKHDTQHYNKNMISITITSRHSALSQKMLSVVMLNGIMRVSWRLKIASSFCEKTAQMIQTLQIKIANFLN
jgi:hypothetical protein